MTFHRLFQPVTEFRLNSQKTQPVVARYGVGTVYDRKIDRAMLAETVLYTDVGDRGGQIGYVGFDRPAVGGTYGIGLRSFRNPGDRLRRLRFRPDGRLLVRRIGFGRRFRCSRFRPAFGFFVFGQRTGRHDVSLGQRVGNRIRLRTRKHIGYGGHICHPAPPLRGIRRPEMVFFQSLVDDEVGFDLVASVLRGREVLLAGVVRGTESQYAHFHVARFDREPVLPNGPGEQVDSGCVSLVVGPEHAFLRSEPEDRRISPDEWLRRHAGILP